MGKTHLLLPELLGHVLGRAAGHVNPGLGEEGAGPEQKKKITTAICLKQFCARQFC
jgi:hypothetical protein